MTESTRPRVVSMAAAWETLLIVLGLLASVFLGRHEGRYDGWVRSDALTQLLTTGKLPEIRYSMVGPIFATPLWYLGKVAKDSQWWVDRYNVADHRGGERAGDPRGAHHDDGGAGDPYPRIAVWPGRRGRRRAGPGGQLDPAR